MNHHFLSRGRKQYVSSLAKTSKHLLLLLTLALWVFSLNAQNRPNINTLNVDPGLTTAQEQTELAQAIHDFVDNNHDYVELHLTPLIHTVAGGTCFTNTSTNFLPWHRFYITKLEEHLTSVGLDKYVPLPKWDPSTSIPNAFFNGPYALASPISTHPGWNPLPALTNQSITGTTWWTNVQSCNAGGITSQNFYTNLASNICNYSTRDALGQAFAGGPGHHGNVHVGIGGTMGGSFHQAPGAMIFYLWHAYLDDEWKRWECTCGQAQGVPSGPDLFMADLFHDQKPTMMDGLDIGYEPFPVTEPLWQLPIYESTDIWNRVGTDGVANQEHELPDYSSTNPNTLYVRVRNRGCSPSNGTEELKVYWTKAAGANVWPTQWVNNWIGSVLHGDIIATVTLPVVNPGEIKIIPITWYPPNPASFGETESHICLLARIETSTSAPYGMTYAETWDVADNVVKNNNIIWRNTKVINDPGNGLMRVRLGNPCDIAQVMNIRLAVPTDEQGDIFIDDSDYDHDANLVNIGTREMLTDNGIVTVNLGPDLYAKWAAAGKQGNGIDPDFFTHIDDAGEPRKIPLRYLVGEDVAQYTVAITGPDATLKNLSFAANEIYTAEVRFNFLVPNQTTDKTDFGYLVAQEATVAGIGCDGVGGVTARIKRPTCGKPKAGQDITIGPGCQATLDVNPAGLSYAWFNNSNGNLVGTTKSVTVSPNHTTTYEVQVVYPNGCVGYDLVNVIVDQGLPACNWRFHDLQVFPNPIASGQTLTVSLITDESAVLGITFMTITGEIIKDMQVTTNQGTNEYQLGTSGLSSGTYKVRVQALDGPGDQTETVTIE